MNIIRKLFKKYEWFNEKNRKEYRKWDMIFWICAVVAIVGGYVDSYAVAETSDTRMALWFGCFLISIIALCFEFGVRSRDKQERNIVESLRKKED